MPRPSAHLALAFCLLLAPSTRAQDTIPASEILKVWEKTAIKNARVQFEEINRQFLEIGESESEVPSPITLVDGDFYYAQGSGMRMKYNDPQRVDYSLFQGIGKSIHDSKKAPPVSISLEKAGETQIEKMAFTDVFRLWLDPCNSRYGGELRELGDTKLKITRDKMGNERVEIDGKKKVTLAKEYDWRPINICQQNKDSKHPLYSFQFERVDQGTLLLRNCVFTMLIGGTDQPRLSCEWTISSLKPDVVKDADIDPPVPTPALIHDSTVSPTSEYFLRKDGSKTPYSSKEHYKILDEMKAEKQKEK